MPRSLTALLEVFEGVDSRVSIFLLKACHTYKVCLQLSFTDSMQSYTNLNAAQTFFSPVREPYSLNQ